jgi:predicted amidohydrolase
MAGIYTSGFKSLAKEYSVTIIGGSILLQEPRVLNNKSIDLSNGSLENITAVFNPDGSIQSALTKKAFPIADELPFVKK